MSSSRPAPGWRPGRRSAVALLALLPIAGAAIAAGTHPELEHRFVATAAVVLAKSKSGEAGSGTPQPAISQRAPRIQQLIDLDPVIERIRRRARVDGTVDELRARTSTKLDPARGLVVVRARDRSPERARALANAVVYQAATLAEQLRSAGGHADLVIGDFEHGPGIWGAESVFSAPPERMQLAQRGARYGAGWLRVTCASIPGCGPAAKIEYPFRAGTTYRASAWMRSFDGKRVGILFGSSATDVATQPAPRLTRDWTRATVHWTPKRDASVAEVGFLSQTRRTSFGIDGVLMSDPFISRAGALGPVSNAEEARAIRLSRNVAVVVPAEPAGSVTASTARWALGGAGAGVLVALASLGAGYLARRRRGASNDRREHPEKDPDAQVEPVS